MGEGRSERLEARMCGACSVETIQVIVEGVEGVGLGKGRAFTVEWAYL